MLKRIAVLVACVGLLNGCQALQSLGVSPATITAIQQAAVSVCGFLPTVETVIGIVSGGMSAVPGQVANAICAAVAANQAPAGVTVGRVGATAPLSAFVGNTQVKGVFVR